MNILFIGSSGPLSLYPLMNLLTTPHSVCAVAMEITQTNPFYNHLFPIHTPADDLSNLHLDSLAQHHNLPVIIFDKPLEQHCNDIKQYSPDIILVSCFAKKIPESILSIPRYGCFNLHPSLLPDYRGPMPVFWQFRMGASEFGVSLHRMTSLFDRGDIILQSSIALADATHYMQAKILLAKLGANLIVDALDDLEYLVPNATQQAKESGQYYSYPVQDDYTLSTQWTAKRMFNFIKAFEEENISFPCMTNNQTFFIIEAIDYAVDSDCAFDLTDDCITIPCSTGCVHARVSLD